MLDTKKSSQPRLYILTVSDAFTGALNMNCSSSSGGHCRGCACFCSLTVQYWPWSEICSRWFRDFFLLWLHLLSNCNLFQLAPKALCLITGLLNWVVIDIPAPAPGSYAELRHMAQISHLSWIKIIHEHNSGSEWIFWHRPAPHLYLKVLQYNMAPEKQFFQ